MTFSTVQAAVVQFFGSCGDWVANTIMAGKTYTGVLKCESWFGETQVVHPTAVVTAGIGTVGSITAKVSGV